MNRQRGRWLGGQRPAPDQPAFGSGPARGRKRRRSRWLADPSPRRALPAAGAIPITRANPVPLSFRWRTVFCSSCIRDTSRLVFWATWRGDGDPFCLGLGFVRRQSNWRLGSRCRHSGWCRQNSPTARGEFRNDAPSRWAAEWPITTTTCKPDWGNGSTVKSKPEPARPRVAKRPSAGHRSSRSPLESLPSRSTGLAGDR